MNQRIFKRVLVGFFLLALVFGASGRRAARACGPSFTLPVFVATAHPDPDWDRFASGSLGLVQPTWTRSQLFVAYRYLSGRPLSPTEQKGVVHRWTGGVWSAPNRS